MAELCRYHVLVLHSQKHHESETESSAAYSKRMAYGESAATGRGKEHVARNDNNLWLCDRGLESFPGSCLIDRRVGRVRLCQSNVPGDLKTLLDGNPIQYSRQRLTGPPEGPLEKCATCVWAVVRMDHDGRMIPWCGVGGNMPVEFSVQRTIKSADIFGLIRGFMFTDRLAGSYPDNLGVDQALNKGEVNCTVAGHKDAEMWAFACGTRCMSTRSKACGLRLLVFRTAA